MWYTEKFICGLMKTKLYHFVSQWGLKWELPEKDLWTAPVSSVKNIYPAV